MDGRFSVVRTIKPLLVAAALLGGVARAGELDTATLDQLRSAVAEAAAIGQAETRGQVTHTYAQGLRQDIRQDLQGVLRAPGVGDLARQALRAVDARDQADLLLLKQRLVGMERAHGRAG